MNANERAEKIAVWAFSDEFQMDTEDDFKSKVAAELTEARAEAFLEAAEEADSHNGCIDKECMERGGQCGVTIANRLRLRAAPPHPAKEGARNG